MEFIKWCGNDKHFKNGGGYSKKLKNVKSIFIGCFIYFHEFKQRGGKQFQIIVVNIVSKQCYICVEYFLVFVEKQ